MNDGSPTPVIALTDVSVAIGDLQILDSVSLNIYPGEIVGVMGPNGAGKSTTLNAIVRLVPVTGGRIEVLGRENDLPIYDIVNSGLGFVPQGRRIFPSLSIIENLTIGCLREKDKNVVRERLESVLELFPVLRTKSDHPADGLSGGEQQMLAIARALMSRPKVLLLDEPTVGLAPIMVQNVFDRIVDVRESLGIAIGIVEHNVQSLLKIVDRAYVLSFGKVAFHGNGDSILESGILEDVFMGRA